MAPFSSFIRKKPRGMVKQDQNVFVDGLESLCYAYPKFK